MTPAQEYASNFAKRVAMGIIPEQAESVRLRIDDFERFIAIAFLAGSQHALDVQIEMVNQSARDMFSQPRMQASELTRDEYIAKGKALEIDWSKQELFQASKPDVFDRSVLGKFDPSKVLYFSLVPFEGEVSMENSEDGDYVTREDFEQLLELYREATEECKHCGRVRSSHVKGYYNRIFCFDELTQFEARAVPRKHWAVGQTWRDPSDGSDYLIDKFDGYPNTMITLKRVSDGRISTILWALTKGWTLAKPEITGDDIRNAPGMVIERIMTTAEAEEALLALELHKRGDLSNSGLAKILNNNPK